ncbi:PQQ-dependent sugar dehydrogenase [Roseomonas sp. AR75]|uniref:PQQ-dependent sugar dehydrogenase n=1 Tax=Roseomonas sp. AR75 TaxID=2562311 RepID=UPI0010C14E1C|nr:PQQ-dependent sugar dehydrogenase [Roseomonas sp. AR75]
MRALRGALLACLLAGAAQAQPVLSEARPPEVSGVRLATVTEGLERPWGMAFLPDGSILVTERPGRLRILRDGVLDPNPIAGVPAVHAQGQGGLLDVALHPDFARNRTIYLTYAHGTAQANRTRLASAVLDGATLRDLRVLFEVNREKPANAHFGSRILFLPDGTLLLTIGDGGNPPNALDGRLIRENAQDLSNHLGKILRLNADGSAPADNPWAGRADARAELWTVGNRNSQGIAWDPIRNTVWANEHGSSGGDELNRIERGRNYGWPVASHSVEYRGGAQIGVGRSAPGTTDPVLVWMTTSAPSGLAVYTGERFPAWRGDLFSGGLRGQDVRRIRLDPAGRVLGEETIPVGRRVRDVRQGPDGFLYLLTDEPSGARIIRVEPG